MRVSLALALVLGGAASTRSPQGVESWRLFQGLHRAGRIELVLPTGKTGRTFLRLAQPLREAGDFEVVNAVEGAPGRAARILVGESTDSALLGLAAACGVEPLAPAGGPAGRPGFRVLGREFAGAGDALVAVFADPERADLPLCLFLGNDLDSLGAYLSEIPALTRPFLRVYSDGDLALTCPLLEDGAPLADQERDFLARRNAYFAEASMRELPGITLVARAAPEREQWADYGQALVRARKNALGWLEASDAAPVELWVYTSLADMEHCLGEADLSLVNPLRPRVHVLLASGLPHDGGSGLARAVARTIAGTPQHPWVLDGLAVAAAGSWWGRPLEPWLGLLSAGDLIPDTDEIVRDRAGARWSEHVLLPARGFLFHVLQQKVRGRALRALWVGADFDTRTVEAPFRAALQRAALRARPQLAATKQARQRLIGAGFRHGIALYDQPGLGQGPSRYGTSALTEALEDVRAFGADAVSFTVFASSADPCAPLVTLRPRPAYGSASDLALAHAALAARERKQRSLLALEPLAHPGGSWADGLLQAGQAEPEAFWTSYGGVALHYALLAELLRVEVFSLGANLRDATRTEPRGEVLDRRQLKARQAGWKSLLGRVRAAFSGGLTYCARFPSEAQEIGFWEGLDFVGLTLFPRLAAEDRVPGDEELARMLRFELLQAVELGVRWNRPVLLLQTGYPSRSAAWQRPAFPRGEVDPEAQRRFYLALADALRQRFENWETLRGLYLWKWDLDPSAGGPGDGGFTPQGKPAEELLPRLFSR